MQWESLANEQLSLLRELLMVFLGTAAPGPFDRLGDPVTHRLAHA